MSLNKLIKAFNLDITNIGMDTHFDTEHNILHKFAEEVILPIHAITHNVQFITFTGKKHIITADNVRCECVKWKELHLLTMEEEVQRLYHISAWDFAQRWYKYDKDMVSMSFIYMKLNKEEKNE